MTFRFGKILILQDVDAIDPILFPILRNDYIVQGWKNKTIMTLECLADGHTYF